MDYMLFAVGISLIICGILVTYLLVSSALTFSKAMSEMQAEALRELIETKKNELSFASVIGAAIGLIGILLVGKAIRKV